MPGVGILYRRVVYGYSENVRDNPTVMVKRKGLQERVVQRDWALGLNGFEMGFALGYSTMVAACRRTQTKYSI